MKIYICFFLLIIHIGTLSAHISTEEITAIDSMEQKMPVIDYKFKPKSLILPASLIGLGVIGHSIDGMKDFHLIKRGKDPERIRIDDYMEWGMFGWVFVCDLLGKEKHNWVDQAFLIVLAEGMNAGMVQGLKRTVETTRPDGNPHSFPSGHTANAFLGAHIAYKEFKDSSPTLAYSGYALATFVAASRLYHNRHWMADVVAGAGFGILSVELSYLIYFPIRNAIAKSINKRAIDRLVIAPMMTGQTGGLYLSFSF